MSWVWRCSPPTPETTPPASSPSAGTFLAAWQRTRLFLPLHRACMTCHQVVLMFHLQTGRQRHLQRSLCSQSSLRSTPDIVAGHLCRLNPCVTSRTVQGGRWVHDGAARGDRGRHSLQDAPDQEHGVSRERPRPAPRASGCLGWFGETGKVKGVSVCVCVWGSHDMVRPM